jgi:hypothetical protein
VQELGTNKLLLEFHIQACGKWTRGLSEFVPAERQNLFNNFGGGRRLPYVEVWGSFTSELGTPDIFNCSEFLGIGFTSGSTPFCAHFLHMRDEAYRVVQKITDEFFCLDETAAEQRWGDLVCDKTQFSTLCTRIREFVLARVACNPEHQKVLLSLHEIHAALTANSEPDDDYIQKALNKIDELLGPEAELDGHIDDLVAKLRESVEKSYSRRCNSGASISVIVKVAGPTDEQLGSYGTYLKHDLGLGEVSSWPAPLNSRLQFTVASSRRTFQTKLNKAIGRGKQAGTSHLTNGFHVGVCASLDKLNSVLKKKFEHIREASFFVEAFG